MYYHIVTRNGRLWGSPMRDGDQVLRAIPRRVRGLMIKLGFRVMLFGGSL